MKMFSKPSGLRYFLYFILAASFFLTAFQAQANGGISPFIVALIVILLIILILIGLWLYRSRQAPAPEQLKSTAPLVAPKPDDLTIIEGIGPKIASILQSAGITTFSQLAVTDVTRLREVLEQGGIRLADPGTWPEQARLAAAGDMAGLKDLQDRLNAGRAA